MSLTEQALQQTIRRIYEADRLNMLMELHGVTHSNDNLCNAPLCQHSTQLYPWFCNTHGPHAFEMEIKPSTIVDAGMGLFTTHALQRGDFIALYTGDVLFSLEFKERYPHDDSAYTLEHSLTPIVRADGKVCMAAAEYAKKLPKGRAVPIFIDASHIQSCLARYINDATNSNTGIPNATFVPYQGKTCPHIIVIAASDIPAGSEILVEYGSKYKLC